MTNRTAPASRLQAPWGQNTMTASMINSRAVRSEACRGGWAKEHRVLGSRQNVEGVLVAGEGPRRPSEHH